MPAPAFPAARTCSAGSGRAAGPPAVRCRHVSRSARPAPWCRHPDRAGHSRNTRPPSSRRDRWPARHGCARWHRCRMWEGSAARSGSASPSARCAAHARGVIGTTVPAFETGFGNICHVVSSAGSPRPVCSSCPSDGRSPGLRPFRPPRLPGIAPSGMKRGTSRQQLRGQLRTWHARHAAPVFPVTPLRAPFAASDWPGDAAPSSLITTCTFLYTITRQEATVRCSAPRRSPRGSAHRGWRPGWRRHSPSGPVPAVPPLPDRYDWSARRG